MQYPFYIIVYASNLIYSVAVFHIYWRSHKSASSFVLENQILKHFFYFIPFLLQHCALLYWGCKRIEYLVSMSYGNFLLLLSFTKRICSVSQMQLITYHFNLRIVYILFFFFPSKCTGIRRLLFKNMLTYNNTRKHILAHLPSYILKKIYHL